MLDGVMLLWFLLAALSLVFVAIDIQSTPESPVMKWGFVLLTAYTGVIGAFLYVLGCREPLPGTHEQYTAAQWRQTLGSTMHCVAGDGVGILAGAVLSSVLGIAGPAEMILEYVLGFAFGWTIFQALFMRDMAGGSYLQRLEEHLHVRAAVDESPDGGHDPDHDDPQDGTSPAADNPLTPNFWFVMSMSLLVGFIIAYPMNWWLVANHLKHGMMTVRPATAAAGMPEHGAMAMSGMAPAGPAMSHMSMSMAAGHPPRPPIAVMALLSFVALAAGSRSPSECNAGHDPD